MLCEHIEMTRRSFLAAAAASSVRQVSQRDAGRPGRTDAIRVMMISKNQRRCSREGGYALLLVIFLATLMLVGAMVAAPNILTDGKREKETEMIWRGKQYIRGIKLYYRKTGKFPTSMDDLTKPKRGSVRFMRQAYKDPMNKEDGSWRLIYVGPAGQLVGSLKPPQTLQIPAVRSSPIGTPASAIGSINGTHPGGAQSGGESQAFAQKKDPNAPDADRNAAASTDDAPAADADAAGNPANTPAGETPTIVGGNIIGVGSKINQRSVIVYDKARNYRLFEFIWDPSKDTLTIGGAPGAQVGSQPK